jgi:glycosyltransferase involved in cell wall biosynthesis
MVDDSGGRRVRDVCTAPASVPTVLAVVDYFLPGFKAGGPVRAVANLVTALAPEFRFLVLCRDRDLGDAAPYPGIRPGEWTHAGHYHVRYVPPGRVSLKGMRSELEGIRFDVLYLNSLFSAFTYRLLMLRRLGRLPDVPVVLAPRGELASAALRLKPWRKRAFLRAAKGLSLYRGLRWQASSFHEREDIARFLRWIGDEDAPVALARERPAAFAAPVGRLPKEQGRLRLLFLSRINRMKNLVGALEVLAQVTSEVDFMVCGPVEDVEYWNSCLSAVRRLPPNVTVTYGGEVTPAEVPRVLARHDLLFLPTLGENYGHVVLEALAAGCPVLISDRTPWRDLAEAGVGWDIPLEDRAAFIAALERAAALGRAAHATMVERAVDYARNVAGDASVLEENRALFHGCRSPKNRRGGQPWGGSA